MCSKYPDIKLEPALQKLDDKTDLSSYGHVVHTTAKQLISRRGKNEKIYELCKNEKCTWKACKIVVFFTVKYAICDVVVAAVVVVA